MKNIQGKQKFLAVLAAMACALVLTAAGEGQAAELRKQQRDSGKFESSGVKIYADKNYQGRSQVLKEGKYRASDLRIGNDNLSSIRVGDGYQVTLYQNDNFRGSYKVIKDDLSRLGSFDDKTSSIIVKKISQPHKAAQPKPTPKPQTNLKADRGHK